MGAHSRGGLATFPLAGVAGWALPAVSAGAAVDVGGLVEPRQGSTLVSVGRAAPMFAVAVTIVNLASALTRFSTAA